MKRWTSTWSALLVTGFLAIPGTALAQTPAAPAAPAATTQEKTAQGTPQEHLKQADAALNSIAPTAATGKAKSQIADLKKHITALETTAANSNDAKNAAKWSKEAAAADKILGELLASDASTTGSTSASATTEPKPAGTSGTSASKTAVALDDDTKGKLTTVRSHLTAFAVAMSGAAAAPAPKTSEPSAAATAPASTTPAAPTTTPASPAPATPAEPTPATPAAPAPTSPAQPAPTSPAQPAMPPAEPSPAAPTSPAPAQPAQPSEPTAQPPASAAQAPTDPAASNVNADAAKTALTAARDSLSQMTQLPAAQQLSGDSRTQVTQLIANFNELITTKADWKASFAKVDANVTALIGAETEASAAATAATAPAAPTTGAVGTSGATETTIDAAVKAKLVEFRTHLKEFQKVAGAADPK